MRMLQARAFGYDADVYHLWLMPASNNTIKDHADNPTASLIGLRLGGTQKTARSIILVALSLGGLASPEVIDRPQDIMLG